MTQHESTAFSTTTLEGRIAVVTGGGTGIGAATARTLAARGARVALLGRRIDRIAPVAEQIDGLAVRTDVSDPAAIEAAFDEVTANLGTPDLVVANAGAMLAAPFAHADRTEWRRMLDVNVMGVLDTARAAVPGLRTAAVDGRPADLVLISSIGAHLVLPTYAVYMATKAAVSHLSRILRAELGPDGIRVRAVEPGMTESDLGHDMSYPGSKESLADFAVHTPPISAAAIAEAVAWSVSLPAAVNAASIEVLPTTQG
ncbi:MULTISPECIES: SDR family oxidoreductase [Gordonia]|uniref:SDR family oxidoreductase n=1 Tax=Gordonia TaxID=2053 RepID=UPI00257D63F6|nr:MULTISPECIES: SDR family NAD(P)-dependent oxidoreductase [Gordonia]